MLCSSSLGREPKLSPTGENTNQINLLRRRRHRSKAERLRCDLIDSLHLFICEAQCLIDDRILFISCEMDQVSDGLKRVWKLVHYFERELPCEASHLGHTQRFGSDAQPGQT